MQWFDLKVIAKGHFEESEICHSFHNYVGTFGYLGVVAFSGATALDRFGNHSVGSKWVSFIGKNRALGRALPFLFLGSLVACAADYRLDWGDRRKAHQVAGVKYNILARNVEDAIANGKLSEENYRDVCEQRAQLEKDIYFTVSNKVHNYAKATVLHRKLPDAPAPEEWLKYIPFGHEELEKRNKELKREFLANVSTADA